MNIAICDDNQEYINILEKYILDKNEPEVGCDAFYSGEELVKMYNMGEGNYDVIFLDMEMNILSEIDSMIEIIFEVGINLLETFIIFDFLTKYLGSKYSGKTKKIGFVLAWLTAFAQLCIMNYITEFESVGAYIPIVINFLYAFLFLNGSLLLKMWMSFITHVIVLIIAYLTIILVCNVLGCTPYDIISLYNLKD